MLRQSQSYQPCQNRDRNTDVSIVAWLYRMPGGTMRPNGDTLCLAGRADSSVKRSMRPLCSNSAQAKTGGDHICPVTDAVCSVVVLGIGGRSSVIMERHHESAYHRSRAGHADCEPDVRAGGAGFRSK